MSIREKMSDDGITGRDEDDDSRMMELAERERRD